MSTFEIIYLIMTFIMILLDLLSLVVEIIKLLNDRKHEKK